MKAIPYRYDGSEYLKCEPSEATHLKFIVPRPGEDVPTIHMLPVQIKGSRAGTQNWTWNGSVEAPDLKPSLLCRYGDNQVCHTWINDGEVVFLSDCTHELAGKTIGLPDIL